MVGVTTLQNRKQISKLFVTNMANEGLLLSVENTSDMEGAGVVLRSCEPCMKSNITLDGRNYCTECREFMCEDCKMGHIRFISKDHSFVRADEMRTGAEVDLQELGRCDDHNKRVKFFCCDHSLLCCSACLFVHRVCKHVQELLNIAGVELHALTGLKRELVKADKDMIEIEEECRKSKKDIKKQIGDLPKAVDGFRDSIFTMIESVREYILMEAEKVKSQEASRLGEWQTTSVKCRRTISNILALLSGVEKDGSSQQTVILAKKCEQTLRKMKEHMDMYRQNQYSLVLNVGLASDILALQEQGKNIISFSATRQQRNSAQGDIKYLHDPSKRFKLELLKEVGLVKTRCDRKEPFITGLDFLSDGILVAVDNKNMECLIMNSRLQIKGTFRFETYPRDVATFNENEFAVTLANNIICLMHVDDNVITLTRTLKTTSHIDSICLLDGSTMVVGTLDGPCPVKKISFENIESLFEGVRFADMGNIVDNIFCTFVAKKNALIISDTHRQTVYLYDTDKGRIKQILHSSLEEPRGVCTGPGGTGLVCSEDTNSIVHVSMEGDVIDSHAVDMEYPYSIAMSEDCRLLAVSNNSQGNIQIHVYRINYF